MRRSPSGVLCALLTVLAQLCTCHALHVPRPNALGRRAFLGTGAAAALGLPAVASVDPSEAALLTEIADIREALRPLPALIDEEKWDSVRSVLKLPPVGNCWVASSSTKNALRKLADLRDDIELFELADEVSGALQLADQYAYSNSFIYTQPGSGKLLIKEPKQQIALASQKLATVIDGPSRGS